MLTSTITCPECGKNVSTDGYEIFENGNPGCHDCVQKERERNQQIDSEN